MVYTRRAVDGVIVDENGVVATAEILQAAGIDSAQQKQPAEQAEPEPTVESLQAQLRQQKQESLLLRSKADGFDNLLHNPKFQTWAYEQEHGTAATPVAQPAIQPNVQTTNLEEEFSGFEDGPGIAKLIESIAKRTTAENMAAFKSEIIPELDKRNAERLDPLLNNLATNQQQAEFQALVSQAQAGKWTVAPESIKKEIDFQRQRVPTLSYIQAYDLALAEQERGGVITRSPINAQSGQSNPNVVQGDSNVAQGNPLLQPGGSGAPVVSAPVSGNILDDSLKERADGKSFSRRSGEDIITEAAALLELPIDVNNI